MTATSLLTPAEVKDLLAAEIGSEVSCDDIKLTDVGEKGDGYMSFMTRADIRTPNENQHYIIKWAPRTESFRKLTPTALFFAREIYFYTTTFPTLRKFQADKQIPDPFLAAPKCIKINNQNLNEVIVLENLNENGYKLWNRMLPMDEEHITLVLRQYGKLHATSFAFKDQEPGLYQKLRTGVPGEDAALNNFRTEAFKVFLNGADKLKTLISESQNKKFYDAITNFKECIVDRMVAMQNYSGNNGVMVHGDCWCNNMLFKYEDPSKPDLPTTMRFIDFQLSKCTSPVIDVSYFFYTSASKDKLDDLDRYLKIYHSSLSDHLRALGSDPEEMFTFADLKEEWKQFGLYGFNLCLILFNIMLREKDEAVDISDAETQGASITDVLGRAGKNEDVINKRLLDLAMHVYEIGLI